MIFVFPTHRRGALYWFGQGIMGMAPFGSTRPLDMDAIAKRVACGTHVEPRRSPYFIPPVEPPVAEVVVAAPVVKLTPGQRAEALLRDVLTPDPVAATEVQRLAENASIAARTLRRARERMNVRVFKKSGCWWWALPGWEDVRP
jgi:hypothetical protein